MPSCYDKQMDSRVTKLETEVTALKIEVGVIRSNYVTKEDLHKEICALTWKLVTFVCGFGTALVAATFFIARHV